MLHPGTLHCGIYEHRQVLSQRRRRTVIWSHPDIFSVGVRQPGQYLQPCLAINLRNSISPSHGPRPCSLSSVVSTSVDHVHVLHQVYGQPGEGHTTTLESWYFSLLTYVERSHLSRIFNVQRMTLTFNTKRTSDSPPGQITSRLPARSGQHPVCPTG